MTHILRPCRAEPWPWAAAQGVAHMAGLKWPPRAQTPSWLSEGEERADDQWHDKYLNLLLFGKSFSIKCWMLLNMGQSLSYRTWPSLPVFRRTIITGFNVRQLIIAHYKLLQTLKKNRCKIDQREHKGSWFARVLLSLTCKNGFKYEYFKSNQGQWVSVPLLSAGKMLFQNTTSLREQFTFRFNCK